MHGVLAVGQQHDDLGLGVALLQHLHGLGDGGADGGAVEDEDGADRDLALVLLDPDLAGEEEQERGRLDELELPRITPRGAPRAC